ncbi:MAG: hypothetical protein H7Z72_18310 [Bacteroidetes bacterium]|nr:hypothetical protein [Fibrella sp.]
MKTIILATSFAKNAFERAKRLSTRSILFHACDPGPLRAVGMRFASRPHPFGFLPGDGLTTGLNN